MPWWLLIGVFVAAAVTGFSFAYWVEKREKRS